MVTNIHDAKTNFSKLVQRAEAGEEIVIGRSGRPVAKLVPYDQPVRRQPGLLRGHIMIEDDFDDVDEALIASFEAPFEPPTP